MNGRRGLVALIVAAAIGWHSLSVVYPAWSEAQLEEGGNDFGSYYYATRVAFLDGDPWSKSALNRLSRVENEGRGVHPFLYPPPFLLINSWIGGFSLHLGYRIWFWFDEALAVVTAGLLWASQRRISPVAGPAVAVGFALLTALPNNHVMGQANLLPLAFVLAGFWAEDEDRPFLAGLLVGTAAMLKMSPALLVFLWLFQRNWRAVGGAAAAVTGLTLATLPLVDAGHQLRFYTQVLPTFSSGAYNGLIIPIDLFGNHSVPNLVNHWFPGDDNGMSPVGGALSGALAVGFLALILWTHRSPSDDPLERSLARSAVAVLGLMVPVYTYEHHLVFALPALVALFLAVERGRLTAGPAAVVGVAATLLWCDLDTVRDAWTAQYGTFMGDLLGEVKTAGLLLLFAGAGWAGRRT